MYELYIYILNKNGTNGVKQTFLGHYFPPKVKRLRVDKNRGEIVLFGTHATSI